MPVIDFPLILALALPGLAVWVVGQALVLMRARTGRTSPVGLRLTMVGIGLAMLGPTAAVIADTIAAGIWPLAVFLAVSVGWLPVVFFYLATRPRVTAEGAPEP